MKNIVVSFLFLSTFSTALFGQPIEAKTEVIGEAGNQITVHLLGHASLWLEINGKAVYVDPVKQYLPSAATARKADLILVTHDHGDHFDPGVIASLSRDGTLIVANQAVTGKLKKGIALANGQTWEGIGIKIEAVPAYNTTPGRAIYHPKGRDNGYIISAGGPRLYVAGDTEDIPEMAKLTHIKIAFLPVNQPYTMTPAQAAAAAKAFRPKILIPYHTGETNLEELKKLLRDEKDIELRLRDMK